MTALVVTAASLAALTLASVLTYRRRQMQLRKVRAYDSHSKFSYD